MELGIHQSQYAALIRELEAEGFDVVLERPIEQRGVPDVGGWDPSSVYSLVVSVGEGAGAVISTVKLVAMINKRLRGTKEKSDSEPRIAVIYLPDGQKHVWDISTGQSRSDPPE